MDPEVWHQQDETCDSCIQCEGECTRDDCTCLERGWYQQTADGTVFGPFATIEEAAAYRGD